jgi:hypothetical protein
MDAQPGTLSYDARDLLRAAARGEFIGLPVVLRGWMDLSEKIIATLLVPVGAFCDASGQAEADREGDRPVEKPSSVRVKESLLPNGTVARVERPRQGRPMSRTSW